MQATFTLHSVVLEYVTEVLVERVSRADPARRVGTPGQLRARAGDREGICAAGAGAVACGPDPLAPAGDLHADRGVESALLLRRLRR